MILRIKFLAVVAMAAVLVACGGGGDETPNFAGTYQISTVNLSGNTCGGSPTSSIAAGTDNVVQDGRQVSASNGTIHGTVDGDNGGFTFTETEIINGVTVVTTLTFRTSGSGESTFDVQLKATGTAGNATCNITYSGTATKI
ncbi:MAG TPA: hypothetical protein PKC80_08875 [Burkholderiaceae bacterium]|nr:hypothetical protein [Burkholderiaceae bacterium]